MRADLDRLQAALARFDDELRQCGAPIVRYWAPGIPAEQSTSIVAEGLDIRLPVEAQLWFAWHNGVVDPGPGTREPGWFRFPVGYRAVSLAECVQEAHSWRSVATSLGPDIPPETVWVNTWLPVADSGGGDTLAVDCAGDEHDAAPVHKVSISELARPQVARASPRWSSTGRRCWSRGCGTTTRNCRAGGSRPSGGSTPGSASGLCCELAGPRQPGWVERPVRAGHACLPRRAGRPPRDEHGLDVRKPMRADEERLRGALGRLQQQLEHGGAPITRSWADGIQQEEARSLVERELGLTLPVEARVWFAWHNGLRDDAEITRSADQMVVPGRLLLPLRQCVSLYRQWRQVADGFAGEVPPETIWHPDWFPITRGVGGSTIGVDCGVDDGNATPVRNISPEEPDHAPVASSLTEAVEYWVKLLESGMWYYDPELPGGWQQTFGRLDPGIRIGLVL